MQSLFLDNRTDPVSLHAHILDVVGRSDDAGLPMVVELATARVGDREFDNLDFDALAGCDGPHDPSLGAIIRDHALTLCPRRFLADLVTAEREHLAMVTWNVVSPTPSKVRRALSISPVVSVASGFDGEASTFHVAVPRIDARDIVPTTVLLATHLRRASINAVVRVMTLAVVHDEEDYVELI